MKNDTPQMDFDILEPHSGHLKRFKQKLSNQKQHTNMSWRWLSAAASIVLIIGFGLGTNHQKQQTDLADISPKMAEVQNYFVATIRQELQAVENNRSLETEALIEHALEGLETLEEQYNFFVVELSKNRNEKKIIQAMIDNYQQRLEILENLLTQIKYLKTPKISTDENYL